MVFRGAANLNLERTVNDRAIFERLSGGDGIDDFGLTTLQTLVGADVAGGVGVGDVFGVALRTILKAAAVEGEEGRFGVGGAFCGGLVETCALFLR